MYIVLQKLRVHYCLSNPAVDPKSGPLTPGWKQFDPLDTTSLGILGLSLKGADPGDHITTDRSCAYWNTILPIFPQVSPVNHLSSELLSHAATRHSPHVGTGPVNTVSLSARWHAWALQSNSSRAQRVLLVYRYKFTDTEIT